MKIDIGNTVSNFMANNPNANKWISIAIIVIMIFLIFSLIKHIVKSIIFALITAMGFNMFWNVGLDSIAKSIDIKDYVNPTSINRVVKEINKVSGSSFYLPGQKGRKALELIQENRKGS